MAALGVAIGIAISWLLSHINPSTYDLAEFENGARNGLTVAAALVAFDLFNLHGPRGAWLRRLSFGRTVLIRAPLLTVIPVREGRVFMLVDIKGSTALAERFGETTSATS